jgi:2-polyprenyl-3-methyl-5-hydroxy-6-metoxy-1,4-benzoquinol methylase/uncharacterized protein YbaR (Trm112 family)
MVDRDLLERLVCPRTKKPLMQHGDHLISPGGYEYPIVSNIPILLVAEEEYTHPAFQRSLQFHHEGQVQSILTGEDVDTYVQEQIAATNGNLYAPVIGKLTAYPIPDIRLPKGNGKWLLDIGCNWGRWCLSAAQKGYRVVGLDPNIDAVLAAQRVSSQLQLPISYVVADARYLPFMNETFDYVFSYSVLQHLSKENVKKVLSEIVQVLKVGGQSMIQMPNVIGIRNLYNQVKFAFHSDYKDNIFRVRYWSIRELKSTFTSIIGASSIAVDGFFGLGIQPSDIDILPMLYQIVVRSSELLRHISLKIPLLTYFADSVYVTSTRLSVGG